MSLVVVTPSHKPDFISFGHLHASVLRNTDAAIRHIVVVPEADVPLFSSLGSGRLVVRGYRTALPQGLMSTTWLARLPMLPRGYRIGAVNVRHPWPPLRGWILQQILKIAVVSELDVDVALLIDSDNIVVRPLLETHFRRGAAVRLFRRPEGIHAAMPRHLAWKRTAHELLHPQAEDPESPDYITPLGSWSPELLRQCVARIEDTTGQRWYDVVGRHLEFSEYILYGTYVSTLADPTLTFASNHTMCHEYWGPGPLTRSAAEDFVARLSSDALTVLIQSASGTDDEVRQFIAEGIARRLKPGV